MIENHMAIHGQKCFPNGEVMIQCTKKDVNKVRKQVFVHNTAKKNEIRKRDNDCHERCSKLQPQAVIQASPLSCMEDLMLSETYDFHSSGHVTCIKFLRTDNEGLIDHCLDATQK